MSSSSKDWLAPSAGMELYWDALGIVKTCCTQRLVLQGMSRYGVGDLRHPWVTLLGPSLARLQAKLPSEGSWMSREVFIEWFRLLRTFKGHPVQPLAMGGDNFHQMRLLKAPSSLTLNA